MFSRTLQQLVQIDNLVLELATWRKQLASGRPSFPARTRYLPSQFSPYEECCCKSQKSTLLIWASVEGQPKRTSIRDELCWRSLPGDYRNSTVKPRWQQCAEHISSKRSDWAEHYANWSSSWFLPSASETLSPGWGLWERSGQSYTVSRYCFCPHYLLLNSFVKRY